MEEGGRVRQGGRNGEVRREEEGKREERRTQVEEGRIYKPGMGRERS